MDFRILGPLEVVENRHPLALGAAKPRALLAVLVLNANRVTSSDQLIEALWGEHAPGTAPKALQVYVSKLRKALGRERILTRSPGYELRVEPGELDLERFEELVSEGKLVEALGLWRGPPLAEFAYEPFAQTEIARLEELRLACLEERIEHDLAGGRHAEVVGELETLVKQHPLRERFRGQLMLSLYRSGRQAESLQAYQDARRALVDELGIEPIRQLRELQQAILRQDVALEPPAAAQAAAEPDGRAELEPLELHDEERKVVSVLFVDLVGFTAQSDQADPEDVRAMLRPYHAAAKRDIERFGGRVEKFVGDAVVGIFGAPVAHEDDAERAVRAALVILDSVEEMNEVQPGLDLAVRAAVNTGEALVDLTARAEAGESVVAGDVVNTASRLQQIAAPGTAVVGVRTYEATRLAIDYEELDRVTLKGKAAQAMIWRALGARRFAEEVEPTRGTPFVGREDELSLLRQTYRRAVREAGVQLATVTGEPGIGKTRLLAELRAVVEAEPEPVLWRQGRCLPYGEGITFWALGEILKAQTGILESDGPDQATGKLAAVAERVIHDRSEREWFTARLAPLVGTRVADAAEAAKRTETFTAWRRFLEAIATEAPLVIAFEDLHWADEPLLEFIDHFVDWASGVPILVLCTARPEFYERRPGWGGGKRNSSTISLAPLAGEETARLISLLLGQAVLPAEVQTGLLERAGGNPLYAEEFVRMLTDRGILERRGPSGHVTPGAEIEVPETVQALITARLDTLAPDRKALLHDAAIIGKVFWSGALCAMGGRETSAVEEGLHELAQKELVRPVHMSSVRDQSEYSFWHALVRDAAYGQIPRALRVRKHRAAAAWIERLAGSRVDDRAEILAHHYGHALELARAAGDADAVHELRAPARRFLALAGNRALELDVERAEAYYRAALELVDEADPDRARLLVKLAHAASLAGRLPEAERGYEEAIAELLRQGDVLAAGEAMVGLVATLGDRGETQRSQELLGRAIELLDREPPGRELVIARDRAARDHWLAGRERQAREWSIKAFELAQQLGLEDHASRALQLHGMVRFMAGDLGSVDDMREALRRSLELGLGAYTVNAYCNLGEQVWLTEGPAAALDLLRAGIDFGEKRGIVFKARWTEAESLWLLYDVGAWDDLVATADRLVRWDDSYGGTQVGVVALSYKAQVLAWRGEVAEAAFAAEQFLPRARTIGDPQVLAPALVIGALIASARGQASAAVALVEEFERVTRTDPGWRANRLEDALQVCVSADALELGATLLEGVEVAAARHRHGVLAARAVLAESHGDIEQALDLYGEVAQRWAEYGFVLGEGQALLGECRCLRTLGRGKEAEAKLAHSREVFDALGARPLVADVDALVEATTAA